MINNQQTRDGVNQTRSVRGHIIIISITNIQALPIFKMESLMLAFRSAAPQKAFVSLIQV